MSKPFQFFTTDQGLIHGTWFPMDHFFYAPRVYNPNGGFVEQGVVVHIEGHASIRHPNGFSVSVIQGEGENAKVEECDDYPTALRRMADIIEAHTKAQKEAQKKVEMDLSLKVEGVLSQQEKDKFLQKFTSFNPSWKGAKVADVLSEMHNTDFFCEEVEEFFEQHGEHVQKMDPTLVAMCIYVALLTGSDCVCLNEKGTDTTGTLFEPPEHPDNPTKDWREIPCTVCHGASSPKNRVLELVRRVG